jgi:transcription elongation factor GreB
MTRYRPASPSGSQFITPAGAERMRAELDELWKVERPRVTQAVSEAAAQGDRSENAEYTYGKRRLREIDRRVRFLRKRLDGMVVVAQAPSDRRRVFFGAWVTLEDDRGEQRRSIASSGRTNSTWPRTTSAWTHRSPARCCGGRSTMKSRCSYLAARSAT